MKIKALQQYVFNLLDTKLPSHFYYHNKEHTQYVLDAVLQLAAAENVSEQDIQLLSAAAILHDVGYIETVKDHEDISCAITRQVLPLYDCDTATINAICELIMVTKMPQQAHSLLARIICDADLYYLGTTLFFQFGERLFRELTALQLISSRNEWDELQVQFLSSHRYFTAAANRLLYGQKLANLFLLKAGMRHY